MNTNDAHPYQPPGSLSSPLSPARPGVWTWYVVYCVAMGMLYAGVLAMGIVSLAMSETIAADDPTTSAGDVQIFGVAMIAISLPICIFYCAAPLLPKRRFAWIYGIVAIALGMTSLCCLPVTIPLIIFWIKPETIAYFQSE